MQETSLFTPPTWTITFNTPPLRSELTDISYPGLLRLAGFYTGFIGKFGIESNGQLLVENEKQALGQMFDVFDNFELGAERIFGRTGGWQHEALN